MAEEIVGQPLTRITVYQCPSCSRIVRDDAVHAAYPCPWGCGSRLVVLRTEYEARDPDRTPPADPPAPQPDAIPLPTRDEEPT